MKWFREWREWVQWKREQDENVLRDKVLVRVRKCVPGATEYLAESLIAEVRDHDRRNKRYWHMA